MKPKKSQPLDMSRAPTSPAAGPDLPPPAQAPMASPLRTAGGRPPLPVQGAAGETPSPAGDAAPERLLEPAAPNGWPIYATAFAVSVLWALAPVMFAWGYRREVVPFQNDGFALTVFALLAFGPAVAVWVAAFVLHQGLKLAAEMRRAQALANTMIQPAALAASGVGSIIETVREEIEQARSAAADARAELLALRDVVAAESRRLIEAAEGSNRAAAQITTGLGAERERMNVLTGVLDSQAVGVLDAINRHARMVAEASDLAETQIREAEAALTARAADLAAAAGEASDAARVAGEDLSRQIARLETAGLGVGDQVRLVEEGLTEQRAALVAAAHGMRADHEAFAAEAETRLAQLSEVIANARAGTTDVTERAAEGAGALQGMIASAAEQLRTLAESAAREREQISASVAQTLGAVTEAAARERESLEQQARAAVEQMAAAAEQAGQAAAQQAQIARERVDNLGEAAFGAGQKADAVFEARLKDARTLIEQSAQLVTEAGERSSRRLDEGLASARTTIGELEALLSEVESRAAQLPADAHARVETVRQSIERGMDELMASARRAAEETQNIDAAFQERVRRNYDMLSEAVRLMGVVAGAASTPPAPRPAPAPAQAPEPPPQRADPSPAERTRLRLTPTASDAELKTVFEAPGSPAQPAEDGWTWKELLSSMDEPTGDDDQVAHVLLSEVEAMGIDAGALLPRMRIDEIAAALDGGEVETARAVVRRLAPAAVRRLARRMMSDRYFHGQTERFTRRYHALVDEAMAAHDPAALAGLLGADQGRAYLLVDAAVGDPG
jgi:hypothetical protein